MTATSGTYFPEWLLEGPVGMVVDVGRRRGGGVEELVGLGVDGVDVGLDVRGPANPTAR